MAGSEPGHGEFFYCGASSSFDKLSVRVLSKPHSELAEE
jgi:hypothetical protein